MQLIILFSILITAHSQNICTGGAHFLSKITTYKVPFNYDCTNSNLNLVLNKLKKTQKDPFVSYYLSDRPKRNVFEGSGDEDDEDYDLEASENEEENIENEEENIKNEEVFSKIVPIEGTPIVEISTIPSFTESSSVVFTLKSSSPSTFTMQMQSSIFKNEFYGSGDFEIPEEQISTPKTTIKLQKILLPSGQLQTTIINDTCTTTSPSLNFLQMQNNNVKTTLITLPTTDDISDHETTLTCQNNNYQIYYSVRQRQKSRNYNHLITIQYGTVDRSLAKISEYLNELGPDLVLIKRSDTEFPFEISFTNESLISSVCPIDELKRNFLKIKNHKTQLFDIRSVKLSPLNSLCDNSEISEATGQTTTVSIPINYPPSIKNQIDEINGKVGQFLVYGIKSDFCYDPEDGSRVNLSLKNLKTMEDFGTDFWMQFDAKNNEIYGLPMNEGVYDVVVVCADKGGKTATDVLTLQIKPPQPKNYNSLFTLHFQSIPFNPPAIRKFITKLQKILSPEIQVKSITSSSNHVHFSWYNTSNPSDEFEIAEIRRTLFSDEGGVNKNVKAFFAPEFNLTSSGGVVPVGGVLLGGQTPVDQKEFDFGRDVVEDEIVRGDEWLVLGGTYLTTYIIPSVLIAFMILLALLIACLLSRKKTTPTAEENFISSKKKPLAGGVPVIFQDELEQQQALIKQQQMQQRGQLRQSQSVVVAPPSYYSSGGRAYSGGSLRGQRVQYNQDPPSYPDPYSTPSHGNYQQNYQPPPAINYYSNPRQQSFSYGNERTYVPP